MAALAVISLRSMPGSLFTVVAAILFAVFCFAIAAGQTAILIDGRHSSTFLCEELNRGGVEKRPRAGLSSPVGKRQTVFEQQFYSLRLHVDNCALRLNV